VKNNFNISACVVSFYELFINAQLRVILTVMQIVNNFEIYVFIFWKNVISSFVSSFSICDTNIYSLSICCS